MPSKRRRGLFDPKSFLANFGEGRTTARHRQGDIVFSQGDPADAVFHIERGKVELTAQSKTGRVAVLAMLGPGDYLGEGCLNNPTRRVATATAVTNCVVTRLDRAAMIRALRDHPAFSKHFMSFVLSRTVRIEADLLDQLLNSIEKRLAKTLLLLANFSKEGRPEPITAPVTQDMLAEMVGTTRARVSSLMTKFRRLGFVDYNGHLEVHSALLSVVLRD